MKHNFDYNYKRQLKGYIGNPWSKHYRFKSQEIAGKASILKSK